MRFSILQPPIPADGHETVVDPWLKLVETRGRIVVVEYDMAEALHLVVSHPLAQEADFILNHGTEHALDILVLLENIATDRNLGTVWKVLVVWRPFVGLTTDATLCDAHDEQELEQY